MQGHHKKEPLIELLQRIAITDHDMGIVECFIVTRMETIMTSMEVTGAILIKTGIIMTGMAAIRDTRIRAGIIMTSMEAIRGIRTSMGTDMINMEAT